MTGENDFDFGDASLNDPDYEKKVQDDGTLAEPSTDGADQSHTPGEGDAAPQGDAQHADDAESGDAGKEGASADGSAQPDGGKAGEANKDGKDAAGKPGQNNSRNRYDDKGNVVDKDGQIIAKAGQERRVLEAAQRDAQAARDTITTLTTRNNELTQQLADAKVLNGAPQELGLTTQEVELGLQAMVSFKQKPAETARWMLQEAMKQGYTLHQIVGQNARGQVDGGSLDLNAVKGMISEALKPVIGDRQAQTEQAQAEAAATEAYNSFLAQHDNASIHEDVIARMMQQGGMTAEVAYWRLREHATSNGLDFTRPLADQVHAANAAAKGGNNAQPNGNAARNPPMQQPRAMPNGSASAADASNQASDYAGSDDDWGDIVKASMHAAGMFAR